MKLFGKIAIICASAIVATAFIKAIDCAAYDAVHFEEASKR